MIGRLWRGWARPENADAYEQLLRGEVLPGIHRIGGHRGAYLLRREHDGRVEFVTLTLFDDLDAVRRFETVPESAMALLAGGANGALKTGDTDPGTTGRYDGVAMPANFRDYRYFGVARAEGRTRTLEAYDAVDRLADPG
jgi:heme-degrading monooxygenase HmoA